MNPNPINSLTRRQFFTTTVAGAAGVAALVRGETSVANAQLFSEPARDLPLVSNADDIGFFRAMFDTLIKEGAADPKRIYVVGGSNGGVMTQFLVGHLGVRDYGAIPG